MFVRVKKIGGYEYLYLVENVREGGRHVQRVIKALGRRDEVEASGLLDGLIAPPPPPFHRAFQLLSRRVGRGPPPQYRSRPGVRPPLAGDRLSCRAASALGRAALRLRPRARDLHDGGTSADGLRLRSSCQHMATDARRP